MGTQTTVRCAQAEDSDLLGPLQSPNWVKVRLVHIFVFLLVSIKPRVEKYLGLSVGDRVLCLRSLTAEFCKSVCCFVSCQSHMIRHLLKGYWELAREECRPWIIWSGSAELRSCRVDRESMNMTIFPICFSLSNSALQLCKWPVFQLDSLALSTKATRNRRGSGVPI